jgi:3-oxoacyl-[acyl-carrier protein] reductase
MKAASQVFSLPALRSLGELASTDSFSYLLWREPARLIVGTGSARDIGKAIPERFGRLGAHVIVNYSTSEQAAKETVATIERLGGAAIAVQADVAKVADIDRLFATALERFGHLDIVVANAGLELVDQPVLA